MLKFEIGKKYSCDSFFSGNNMFVIVIDRTDSTITISYGIDEESGLEMTTTFNIEIFNKVENILIEKYEEEENYLSATNIWKPISKDEQMNLFAKKYGWAKK